jgi:signal transduction histidine kinase
MTGTTGPGIDERRPRGRRSLAFDIAVALAAIAAEVGQVVSFQDTVNSVAVLLAVVGGGAVAFRRSFPVAVCAIAIAANAAIVALGVQPAGVSALVALYTIAAMRERRVSLAALVPVAIVSVLSIAAPGNDTFGDAVGAALVTVGVWGLGAYMGTRRRYLRELEARAADLEREREQLARLAVQEERTAIARELHDIVAHSVSVMLVGVRGARDVLRTAPDVADDTLARVETSGEESLAELRRILALLRVADAGAESRPLPSLDELDELVAEFRGAGLPVHLEVAGEPHALPGGVGLSVYRIVQEALTNVLKHSRPTRVLVMLAFRGSDIEVEVVDDGVAAEDGVATSGHGIVGMRERVALLGGELETGWRAGGGFRVAARLPAGGAG